MARSSEVVVAVPLRKGRRAIPSKRVVFNVGYSKTSWGVLENMLQESKRSTKTALTLNQF
jgi:hypothetical protein